MKKDNLLIYCIIIFVNVIIAQPCQIKLQSNIIANSEFNSNLNYWNLKTYTNSCATNTPSSSINFDNGTIKIYVNNNYGSCSTFFNYRTMITGDISGTIYKNKPYVFTFKAKTNSATPINFYAVIREKNSPYNWKVQFKLKEIHVLNQWQQFCKVFFETTDLTNIEVAFFFGEVPDGTIIWIDDVFLGYPEGYIESGNIRINQLGYFTDFPKEGISTKQCSSFVLKDAFTNSSVYSGNCQYLGTYPHNIPQICNYMKDTLWKLDFSTFNTTGKYYLETNTGYTSQVFSINNNIYDTLRTDVLRFFDFQKCGLPLSTTFWGDLSRGACHSQDLNATIKDTSFNSIGTKDVSGGWHDASDYIKYTTNNALTVVYLAKTFLENYSLFNVFTDNINIPASGNGIPDIVDILALDADFLLKMQDTLSSSPEFGGAYSKVSTIDWDVFVLPPNEITARYITPPTTISTAVYVSAMCYLYRALNQFPMYQNIALRCSTAAFRGWNYLNNHIQSKLDKVNDPSGGYIQTATYDWFPDNDERLWAAAELYRTFQDNNAHNYFLTNYSFCNNTFLDVNFYSFSQTDGWTCPTLQYHRHFAWLGFLAYLESSNVDLNVFSTIHNWLISHADTIVTRTNNDYFSFSLKAWGENGYLLQNAFLLKKAFDITGNNQYLYTLGKNLDYIMGKNIVDYSFITSYGYKYPNNVYHLHLINDNSVKNVSGMLVLGPLGTSSSSPSLPVSYNNNEPIKTIYFDTCTPFPKRYLDNPWYSYVNEVTTDLNAKLFYALNSLLPLTTINVNHYYNDKKLYNIFPIPSEGIIYIENKEEAYIEELTIYNTLGQKLFEKYDIKSDKIKIDLSIMNNGIYFVKIIAENSFYINKIIIQK